MAALQPELSINLNKVFVGMPVTLDPDAAAIYQAFQDAGRPAYETLPPSEAREYYRAARSVVNPDPPALESNTPLSIPAPHGTIPARIYTPKTCLLYTSPSPRDS